MMIVICAAPHWSHCRGGRPRGGDGTAPVTP